VQIVNAQYGIKCGGYLEASVAWSVFDHISTIGCGWGTYFENSDSCTFSDINNTNYTLGAHWHMSSGSSIINLGDSLLQRIIFNGGTATTYLSRQVVIGARGASSNNGLALHNLGGVGGGTATQISNTISIPASGTSVTLTTGNTNQYAVGIPVTVSVTTTSVPVLTAQQVYFVQSIIDSTHFTLSNNAFGSTPITWSGAQAGVTMITKGFPGLEIVGYDTSVITGLTAINIGCESGGSMAYLLQGCTGSGGPCDISLLNALAASTGLTNAQIHYQNVVARNCQAIQLTLSQACNSVDFDSSMQYVTVAGYQAYNYQQGYTGIGFLAPPNTSLPGGPYFSGFGGAGATPKPDLWIDGSYGLMHTKQILVQGTSQTPVGQYAFAATPVSPAFTLGPNYINSAAAGVYQLPAITVDAQLNISFFFCNQTAGNQTVQTTTSGGSLNIVGVVPGTTTAVSATSVTLPGNTNMRVTSAKNNAGTYFWAIG
jgi:hypothetical protein